MYYPFVDDAIRFRRRHFFLSMFKLKKNMIAPLQFTYYIPGDKYINKFTFLILIHKMYYTAIILTISER